MAKGEGKKLFEGDKLSQQTVPECPSACHHFTPIISAHTPTKMRVMSESWNDNSNSRSNNNTHGGGAGLGTCFADKGIELVVMTS